MTDLRQKIAQMLIVGFEGTTLTACPQLEKTLKTDGLGGVILFDLDLKTGKYGKNLVDQEQIRELTQQLQSTMQQAFPELPLFISMDYEGGKVDRLKTIPGCLKTITPAQFANLPQHEQEELAENMAKLLHSLGFNLNFAPVVDLAIAKDEGIIAKQGRSFSDNFAEVTSTAKRFVRSFMKQRVRCCFKHFPGHGSARGDTHEGFVDVTDCFELRELEPYRALCKQNADTLIMTAHVINRHLDPSGLPATLSRPILHQLLREEIGFTGIIISDDLQMQAISEHYSLDDSLCMTINAGADMLIFANQLGEISAKEVIDRIESLVLSGKISAQTIETAYERIARMKADVARF